MGSSFGSAERCNMNYGHRRSMVWIAAFAAPSSCAASVAEPGAVGWLVAQTESQREQVAARWLKDQRFEPYLPRIRVKSIIRQRVVERLAPLFPSYLFVRAAQCWQPILRTVAIIDVLYSGEHPAHLDDAVIDTIRASGAGRHRSASITFGVSARRQGAPHRRRVPRPARDLRQYETAPALRGAVHLARC